MRVLGFIFLFISHFLFSQKQNRIQLDYLHHFSMYHQPNFGTQQFIENGGNYSSNSYEFGINMVAYHQEKFSATVGLRFGLNQLILDNYVDAYYFYDKTYTFENKASVDSYSLLGGLQLGVRYQLMSKTTSLGFVGLNSTVHFYDKFRFRYLSDDFEKLRQQQSLTGFNPSEYQEILRTNKYKPNGNPRYQLSIINMQFYYGYNFISSTHFSVAGKVSIGTNLHSDWDQFKKYVWIGAGLEVGLFQIKNKKQTNEK